VYRGEKWRAKLREKSEIDEDKQRERAAREKTVERAEKRDRASDVGR
jgi:hypothetical protein